MGFVEDGRGSPSFLFFETEKENVFVRFWNSWADGAATIAVSKLLGTDHVVHGVHEDSPNEELSSPDQIWPHIFFHLIAQFSSASCLLHRSLIVFHFAYVGRSMR